MWGNKSQYTFRNKLAFSLHIAKYNPYAQFVIKYRVPQKKPSLSEISCGKYYSGWREIHVEFVFQAGGSY